MKTYNIQEAKTHLSRLIEETAQGKEVVIARHGRPMARLTPYSQRENLRPLGGLEGQIHIPEDFDEEDAEVNALFSGRE